MKNIAAALVFFTRLPFWRIKAFQIPAEYFNQVINYWAVVGWLTAVVMAGVLWLSAQILPYSVAIILALMARLILTGVLHEDGLADFMDGFGGGTTKKRILEIMKDSHIGTYGVVGLIFYFLLFYSVLSAMPLAIACSALLVGDPLCKFISSQITLFLPYARTKETSKAHTVYKTITLKPFLISLFFVLVPFIMFFHLSFVLAIIFPIIVFFSMIGLMKKKIQGYTGDCCGATFLLCELSFYLGILICSKLLIL